MPAPLVRVTPTPTAWQAECPVCTRLLEDLEMVEDFAGNLTVDGPDRYPRCYECDTQFEIAAVRVVEVEADGE